MLLCDAKEYRAKKITSINTSALTCRDVCNSPPNYRTDLMLKKNQAKYKASPCCRLRGHGVMTPTSVCSSWLDLCVAPGSQSAEDSGKRV